MAAFPSCSFAALVAAALCAGCGDDPVAADTRVVTDTVEDSDTSLDGTSDSINSDTVIVNPCGDEPCPPMTTTLRIVAANLSSGTNQIYEAPGIRILQGIAPDITLIQEFGYVSDGTFANFDAFIAGTFGPEASYHRGPGDLPNGIVSRYPILNSGTWDDSTLSDRAYDWAKIDIPGPVDLWAVSLHLKASSGDRAQRATQAREVVAQIERTVPAGDFLVVGGDLNLAGYNEAALDTLGQVVVTTPPFPADQRGDPDTNLGRDRPYDHVLVNADFDARQIPVAIGDASFEDGLVVDTREFTPLSAIAPAEAADSGAEGMQHMAVVKDFHLECLPRVASVCTDDVMVWLDDCGNVDPGSDVCECGCAADGMRCQQCVCTDDTCSGNGTCSVVEDAAVCDCADGCSGPRCEVCNEAQQPIAAGQEFNCVIDRATELACWGNNRNGQSQPPGGGGYTHVSAGQIHACALGTAGRIACWGNDDQDQSTPPGAAGFRHLAAGRFHACAVAANGSVACWGESRDNRLQAPSQTGFTRVAAGYKHSCALRDGAIACWGDNSLEQTAAPAGTDFVELALAESHSCAVDTAGTITCWGDPFASPAPAGAGHHDIAVGRGYALALDANSTMVCWGEVEACNVLANAESGLSDLTTWAQTACALNAEGSPTCWGQGAAGSGSTPGSVVAVAASTAGDHWCLREANGELACDGYNFLERLSAPSGPGYTAFDVSFVHGCALDSNGAIQCWGDDGNGQASPPSGTGFLDVAVGNQTSCALDAEGHAICWGAANLELEVTPPDAFSAIAVGDGVACGLGADTGVTCWGRSAVNPLAEETGFEGLSVTEATVCVRRGDGSASCWSSDAEVSPQPGEADLSTIVSGGLECGRVDNETVCDSTACGLTDAGAVRCWAQGGLTPSLLNAPPGTGFTALSAADGTVCVLTDQGHLRCWGNVARPASIALP
ncbi:MAG: alpha-tubulin suppressor-like RCC1 family protein [Myxococcota bacterium]|jgi:alpha-tubulin suppressor-like RCC1 family protein